MKGIFILGEVRGAYRVQAFIDFLIEHGYNNFYINSYRSNHVIIKLINYACDFLKLCQMKYVYVCPCQQQNKLLNIAFILRKQVITDFYISQYDTNVLDRKTVKKGSRYARKLFCIDRRTILKSKYVLFLNKSEQEYYCNLLQVKTDDPKYIVMPLISFEKKAAYLNYYKGKKDKFIICWCGTFIPLQGLDIIIEAISILANKINNFELIIWGDSEEKAKEYVELAECLNVSQYIKFIFEWDNIHKWEKYIVENCDLTLGIFGISDKAKVVLANKVLDGVVYKTPVLTGYSSGAQEFFKGSQDIFYVDNTPISLAEEIQRIMKFDYLYIMDRVTNAYSVYENNFSKKSYTDRMEKLFRFGEFYD